MRSKYESLVLRRGKKRALIAVGRKILIAAYFILRDKVAYKDLGSEWLIELNKQKKIERHLKGLSELGIDLKIINQATERSFFTGGTNSQIRRN